MIYKALVIIKVAFSVNFSKLLPRIICKYFATNSKFTSELFWGGTFLVMRFQDCNVLNNLRWPVFTPMCHWFCLRRSNNLGDAKAKLLKHQYWSSDSWADWLFWARFISNQSAIGFIQLSSGKKSGWKSSVSRKTPTIKVRSIPKEFDLSFCRAKKTKNARLGNAEHGRCPEPDSCWMPESKDQEKQRSVSEPVS